MKPVILVFAAHYLPGYKFGGPVRTIANMVDHLGDDLDFWIITMDRDAHDSESYHYVKVNSWNQVGNAHVFYTSPNSLTLRNIARLIRDTPHDALYLNSFFNFKFTILPLIARRLGLLSEKPVVLAPRGEFSQGALALKQCKKTLFTITAKIAGFYNDLYWQASSYHEEEDILCAMGSKTGRRITIAPNLPKKQTSNLAPASKPRKSGEALRIIFLSRISPKKNLDFTLQVLAKVKIPVIYDIYGPIEDEQYWKLCKALVDKTANNICIRFCGPVGPERVAETFAKYDLFFFPTRGENYGHVIAESLSVGTPVLLSDQTPWRNLQVDQMGWDLPLSEMSKFVEIIENYSNLDYNFKTRLRSDIQRAISKRLTDKTVVKANKDLFMKAIANE